MHALVAFLTALNNPDADGRITVDADAGIFNFVLLNAAAQFAPVRLTLSTFLLIFCETQYLEPSNLLARVLKDINFFATPSAPPTE